MSDAFFKYTTLDTALKIIDTQKVSFKKPYLFNDPFEFLIPSDPKFSNKKMIGNTLSKIIENICAKGPEFKKLVSQSYKTIMDCPPSKIKSLNNSYSDLNKIQHEEPLDKKAIEKIQQYTLSKTNAVKKIESDEQTYRGKLQNMVDNTFLIFCGSKESDNILMWSYYAAEHTGIVLEFHFGNDELFSPKEIKYLEKRNLMDGQLPLSKSSLWEHEKEIRVLITTESINFPPEKNTAIIPYEKNYLTAIYFGVSTFKNNDKHTQEAHSLIKKAKLLNPDIKFYQMSCDSSEYKLHPDSFIP